MQRTDSLEKTLLLGKIEGRRKRGQQTLRWLDGFTNLMDVFFLLRPKQKVADSELACEQAHQYLVTKAKTRWSDLSKVRKQLFP